MRYFYDTEFLDDGRTIELISIGIVAEDGREYYAVSEAVQADDDLHGRIERSDWLLTNVVPHLPLNHAGVWKFAGKRHFALDMSATCVKSRRQIANEVRDFILAPPVLPATEVELWADYGAYDHVALAQLYGSMISLPAGMPMWTHDLRQLHELAGFPDLDGPDRATGAPPAPTDAHNALADARYARHLHKFLSDRLRRDAADLGGATDE